MTHPPQKQTNLDVGVPTLRALREAKEKRQPMLLVRRIELQEEIKKLEEAEGGRDSSVSIVTLKNGSQVVDTAILHGVMQRMSLDIYRSQFNMKMSALVTAEADIAVEVSGWVSAWLYEGNKLF
jgi:hypothetical protein